MKVLVVDSDINDINDINNLFSPLGHLIQPAACGSEALDLLPKFEPDLIFLDTSLSDMNGLDLFRKIRQGGDQKDTPIFIATNDNSIDTKVHAFEYGADDYIIRPFKPEDLVDRANSLVARYRSTRALVEGPTAENGQVFNGSKIVFHSLRGGSGVSSIAANTALMLQTFWEKPTLLMDTAFYNGQVSMLLNINTTKHLGTMRNEYMTGQDNPNLLSVIEEHRSGLKVISAPRYPIDLEFLTEGFWASVATTLRTRFEYIVVDTPHDFSDIVIYQLLDATAIVLVVTPEMASLKVAVSALKTYKQLGINEERIKIVLNHHIPGASLDALQIEKALGVKIDLEIPYDPFEVLRAINIGTPFVTHKNTIPVAQKIEDLAFLLSTPESRKNPSKDATLTLLSYLTRKSIPSEPIGGKK